MTDLHINKTLSAEEKDMMDYYESAARKFCEMQNINPDQVLMRPHPEIVGAKVKVPVWQSAVPMLSEFDMKMLALMATRQDRMTKLDTKPSLVVVSKN